MPQVGSSWLEGALSRLPSAKVTVFGDFCLDSYWLIDTEHPEKSIETGLPVRRVRNQRYSLGGAGNVVANLIALGVGQVFAVGAIGSDLFGSELLKVLKDSKANVDGMHIPDNNWQTMVYAKPCLGDVEDSRIDFGGFNTMPADAIDPLMKSLAKAAASSSVVILNQQLPGGVCSAEVITRINRIIADHPSTQFIVDARDRAGLFQGATLKLNASEAGRLLGESVSVAERVPAARASDYAKRLCKKTGRAVFLTRGENGMIVADQSGVHEVPGIQIIERTDPVGAGDTSVAALAAVLGSGGDALTAARLANTAASITVRKLQTTGTATPAEIRAIGPDPDYVYSPDLADDPRQARYIEGTEIEFVRELPADIHIQHAIFDHDGTLSTLRQGWELIMEPMMVRAVLGKRFADAEMSTLEKVTHAVRQFIDRTTGIQTLVQMKGLSQMVAQFGFVPREEILDEHGYKGIFNEQLLAMVHQRVRKLERGELEPADFQIKNAHQLLQRLHERGVKLYLASGTDETDVVAEAKAMGYAHLFGGRIFGAVGDINVEAKKVVLERIIRENGLSGHQFATFGDGPVEIRETRKRDGICIGLCSDEVRRFGFNPAKRSRLIRAGAGLLVPDFSQLSMLLKILQLS